MTARDDGRRLADHGAGGVPARASGVTENTFRGLDQGRSCRTENLRYALQDAARNGGTVPASSAR